MSEEKVTTRKEFIGGAAATGLTLALGSRFAPLAQAKTASYLAKTKTIVIGVPAAKAFRDHQDHLHGTQLAIDEINALGGIRGRKVTWTTTDFNVFDAQSTQLAFQKIVGQKVAAVTTAYATAVEPPANITAAYGCPYINGDTSGAGEAIVRDSPNKYSNRFSDASEHWYGDFFQYFLTQVEAKGWKPRGKSVHILTANVRYNQVISDATNAALNAGGKWSVVGMDQVVYPTLDWGSAIAQLHKTNPAVVFVSHFDPGNEAAFCKQFVANPVPGALVYLQYAPSQAEFLELAGSAAEGFVWSSVIAIPPTAKGKAFISKYRKKFNEKIVGIAYTAYGYDTAHMLFQAWQAVGDPMNFKAVNRYIRSHPYDGVIGHYDFRTPGNATVLYPDQVSRSKTGIPHLYFQVQNGSHRAITPSPYAAVRYVAPPWAR